MSSAGESDPTRSRSLGPGDVVGQRWRIEEFLKKGGMGRVFRATDLRLGEPVALKLMDPAIVGTEKARSRFFREAQTAAKLRSTNVVQILDFNVDAATQAPYIAMELLRGEDLAQRLARGPLSYEETTAILGDVCSAIGKAHRMEIIHRDLKPANVFLVDDDDDGPLCKVLDFGIVKLGDLGLDPHGAPQTDAGATLGTVSYMSPEQIADARGVDHRADLWSIGVIAYECMTGHRPFRGESLFELVHKICFDVPPAPSRLADVPSGFDAWFARATHRDPDRRFASARELIEALRALAGRPPEKPAPRPAAGQPDPPTTHGWASDANQIDIGALKDLTFKNAVVREFLDSANKHFVSGSKGLGKTLLLTYKRSVLSDIYLAATGRDRRHAAVQFIPEGRPYLDLMGDLPSVDQTRSDLMSRLHECKRLWSFSFRMSIVSYQAAAADAGDPKDLAPLPRSLRGLLEGRPVEPTMVLKELLSLTVRQINQVVDAMERPLERRLRSLHSGVFIFIDKLDQALRRLPRDAWIHMQAGMIEAAWDLMNANRHVKIFATIREEAFSSYESDIKTNLYGATSTLRYAKHELFELLEKLTYYYERLPLREFIHLDVVSAGRSARGESTFDFLYRHTLGRPRDLVILASEISRHRQALDERTFTRIVQSTSAGLLVANVFDEMRVFLEVLRHRDKRDRFLALLPSDVLTHDELVDVWCKFHEVDRAYFDAHGRDADDVYHPFRELFECGLLGVLRADSGAERQVQRFRQPHDAVVGSRHALPRSRYYLLHPSLRALIEPLPGGGEFHAVRHVVIGHGEPWPRHWDLVVDVQRELFRRPEADEEIVEAVFSLLDRLSADVADGEGEGAARRAIAASPTFARLSAHLERIHWDELHLALLDLFPAGRREEETEPTDRVEVAMLLIDIVRSTHLLHDIGDTGFVDHVHRLRGALRGSTNPRLLKGTGDGYLAVYSTVARAVEAARVLRRAVGDPAQLRLVVHWGRVRMSDHDVLGAEVHRLFRIEAVTEGDRVDEPTSGVALPRPGRVTLSRSAAAALPDAARADFRRAGAFRLKGFDAPESIWVETDAVA
ncbi:protein kinase [Sorangium sp. So ce134]